MTGIFWVAASLWLFVFWVQLNNTKLRIYAQAVGPWLEHRASMIDDHPDYHDEAQIVYTQYIPVVRNYFDESAGFIFPLVIIQAINIAILFADLVGGSSYILNGVASIGNAAVIVSYFEIRRRLYAIDGLVAGVSVILSAITIQRAEDEREDI